MDKHTNKIIGVLIAIIAMLTVYIMLSPSTLLIATISYILGTIIG